MFALPIYLIWCLGSVLTYEIHQRSSMIKFPTENTPLTQQIYNVGPPQLFEAESQAVPVVIKGVQKTPFAVLHQIPVTNIPFGEIGAKGLNDGPIPYHQPFIRQESEFHHTVPPPSVIRIPSYTHHKTISKPKQHVQLQTVHHKTQRHQDRIRVPTQKYSSNQQIKTRPNIQSIQPVYSQSHTNKDFHSHQSISPVFKYPTVLQHLPPTSHHYTDYSEHDENPFRRPNTNKYQTGQHISHLPHSEEYTDFDDKIPDWKIKPTSIRDTSIEGNKYVYKKRKLQHPHLDDSKYDEDEDDESDDHDDEGSEESFSYEETQPHFNRYHKPYVPLKTNNNPNFYRPKNELKKIRQPTYDKYKQYNVHTKQTSPVEFFSSKDITDSLPFLNQDDKYINTQNKKLQNFQTPKLISGSEWIPINAPDGALPAKSYDIPAPDLSRVNPTWYNGHKSTDDQRIQDLDSIRNQRPTSSVVYGDRKQQGQGVVSASVLVKQ